MHTATPPPEVYQLHVWLREISPMIWRRLLIRSDSTIADLHLRLRERFRYEYDFGDLWQHEIRVEKKLSVQPKRHCPTCIGGQRAAPPEDCGGPWAFMALQEEYSPYYILERLTEILEAFQAGDLDAIED